MSTLVLELKPDDSMIINGAVLRFKNRTRVELTTRSRFMFGKQIMREEAAGTPANRLYYDLQTAYIGAADGRPDALARARALIAGFQSSLTSTAAQDILTRLLTLIEADSNFEALKLARQIIHHEADLLTATSS